MLLLSKSMTLVPMVLLFCQLPSRRTRPSESSSFLTTKSARKVHDFYRLLFARTRLSRPCSYQVRASFPPPSLLFFSNAMTTTDCAIEDDGAEFISEGIEGSSSLISLDLTTCGFSSRGTRSLAAALERNKSLTELVVEGNRLGDEGAAAIARALERNGSLVHLNLGAASITDSGAMQIASALEKNSSLAHLTLSGSVDSHVPSSAF